MWESVRELVFPIILNPSEADDASQWSAFVLNSEIEILRCAQNDIVREFSDRLTELDTAEV